MPDTRALAVIEDATRDRDLLERARAFATGVEGRADLLVVALATPDEYDELAETLNAIGRVEGVTYDADAVLEGVAGDVADLAASVLDGTVAYDLRTVVETPADQPDVLVDLAERRGCDHLFVPGRRRSPTGKAVFGDRTQQVALAFDGYVTIKLH
jgi:nucleotide-binding universal stress UspA family protein